jgi:hypothetical protein
MVASIGLAQLEKIGIRLLRFEGEIRDIGSPCATIQLRDNSGKKMKKWLRPKENFI